jgi:membrane protease YdiL (CAAX protease family)
MGTLALASGLALRPALAGGPALWFGLGVPYAGLAAVGLRRLEQRGELRPLLAFRGGDASLGIASGLAMLGVACLVSKRWLSLDTASHAWLLRIFLLVGDGARPFPSSVLLLVIVCEELVWRGWVQCELRARYGPRRAWLGSALAYAGMHLPSLFTLADPAAGVNPLLVAAAFGGGLCWGLLALRTRRLAPGLLSHAAFSYFAVRASWWFM